MLVDDHAAGQGSDLIMQQPPILISPSLLAADLACLGAEISRAESAGADELHLDIMDARFVRNLSMGPDVVRMARRETGLRLSVHLMMMQPTDYIDVFAESGAGTLLIHIEAQCDHVKLLRQIRQHGIRAGITLNPETPVIAVEPVLNLVDEVLVMSVHPGFGGQKFMDLVLPKIKKLFHRSRDLDRPFDISVDGGIDADTARAAAPCGANIFIAGTSLFQAADMPAALLNLRVAAQTGRDSARI